MQLRSPISILTHNQLIELKPELEKMSASLEEIRKEGSKNGSLFAALRVLVLHSSIMDSLLLKIEAYVTISIENETCKNFLDQLREYKTASLTESRELTCSALCKFDPLELQKRYNFLQAAIYKASGHFLLQQEQKALSLAEPLSARPSKFEKGKAPAPFFPPSEPAQHVKL